MKKRVKTTTVKPAKRQVNTVTETAIAVAGFIALYLTLFSALPVNWAYYAVLPVGVAFIVLSLLFYNRKYAKYFIPVVALIITAVCISVFAVFKNGLLTFLNGAVETVNSTRHAGYATFDTTDSFGASFLFGSVVAVWLAVLCVFSVKIPHLYVGTSAVELAVMLFIGLYPQYYAVVISVLACVCMLALHSGFGLKSLCCYLLCATVVSGALVPCYFYGGSQAVEDFRAEVLESLEDAVYGSSMPNGKLGNSYGMSSSKDVRLNVTISRLTPTLYLRGFVGSDLKGSKWVPTDKNAYVQNGYQGLLEYIGEDLPVMQYAGYSDFNERNNHYKVTVENVSADRRYVYAPYSLSNYSYGSPYYDLGLRAGILPQQTYSYTVFRADESSERITQADWVIDDVNRTEAMAQYINSEGQYRAFVYDTYLGLGSAEEIVNLAVGDFETTSINTATQYIRAYFLEGYSYADRSDKVADSFASEFFGGEIKKANSAYFATAATLMFRAMGFPARYVEGYMVYAGMENLSETVTVSVTGENTHAWTEVYFDGVGFLPIEVTPTFFTEQTPDVVVDPNDPDISGTVPSPGGEPETPNGDGQDQPDVPPGPGEQPPEIQGEQESPLLTVLKVLVPVSAAVAGLLLIALVFSIRRVAVRAKRHKMLSADGERFGRAAYGIVVHDCKYFGGFESGMLEKLGVDNGGTARFIRITEQCVYGKHNPTDNEREFVMWYISTVHDALLSDCGFFRRLYYKYAVCLVI